MDARAGRCACMARRIGWLGTAARCLAHRRASSCRAALNCPDASSCARALGTHPAGAARAEPELLVRAGDAQHHLPGGQPREHHVELLPRPRPRLPARRRAFPRRRRRRAAVQPVRAATLDLPSQRSPERRRTLASGRPWRHLQHAQQTYVTGCCERGRACGRQRHAAVLPQCFVLRSGPADGASAPACGANRHRVSNTRQRGVSARAARAGRATRRAPSTRCSTPCARTWRARTPRTAAWAPARTRRGCRASSCART